MGFQCCRKLLQNNFVKGTLLIADEGYNGQMIVPEQTSLITLQNDLRNLLNDRTLDFNVGPLYANVNGRLPFRKLIVRYKKSIITDGFQNRRGTTISFGQGSGRELNADDWHHALSSSDPSLVIDVRNYYESERGTFKNSIPLNTSTYSESWDALDKIIDGKDKDTPIYTFCTGGIRCVKVAAYLNSKGFLNVNRLRKGIIGYEEWSKSVGKSHFHGENYLFDRRRE